MKRRDFRVAFCVFVMSVLLSISATAFALVADGTSKSYGPVGGYSYTNQSSVGYTNSSSGVWASTTARVSGSVQVPVSYIGVDAKLYNSAGSLKTSTGFKYNDMKTGGYGVVTPNYYTHDTYYSKGDTRAYTGTGYITYSSNQSPNVNY
ncbi:hypothetical protein [Desulforamulus aeronauticus]|uniref:Uncharacterized protein n=1 Tax=Desulforamulus aeronauticus DSM 10349 TaxID=1121421 RepID=A0A1M6VSB2_9FIRM|nr:hypothetical protein [Desulforamulus aeronauticus]SHK84271.1 hypothetical protein SAMN02745123_03320 [Desulforamulus aeronauticus DSM 10349]